MFDLSSIQTGWPILSDTQRQAVGRNAERMAEQTVAQLDAWGYDTQKPWHLPPVFLLELSAVLTLGLWEHRGFRAHLDAGLPSYSEAARQLGDRALKGPEEFYDIKNAPLSLGVLQVWLERFAWEGPDWLHAEVLVGDVDEDEFADVLAELLWRHREEFSKILDPQEEMP